MERDDGPEIEFIIIVSVATVSYVIAAVGYHMFKVVERIIWFNFRQ